MYIFISHLNTQVFLIYNYPYALYIYLNKIMRELYNANDIDIIVIF